jgi:hypothetical protein
MLYFYTIYYLIFFVEREGSEIGGGGVQSWEVQTTNVVLFMFVNRRLLIGPSVHACFFGVSVCVKGFGQGRSKNRLLFIYLFLYGKFHVLHFAFDYG